MQRMEKTTSEPVRFGLVGGVGFILDGGILSVLASNDWDLYGARAVSFTVAAAVTYYLNRRITFKAAPTGVQIEIGTAAGYALVQSAGALVNLLVFSAAIAVYPAWKSTPLIPLAVGAIFGFLCNYLLSTLLFRWRSHHERR